MQPRPSAETSSPWPSFRFSMPRPYPAGGVSALPGYTGRRSWLSRSEKHRSRAATSAARPIRSARRRWTSARTAGRPSGHITSVRPAARTSAARSSRSVSTPR